jgi:hypothetical protein
MTDFTPQAKTGMCNLRTQRGNCAKLRASVWTARAGAPLCARTAMMPRFEKAAFPISASTVAGSHEARGSSRLQNHAASGIMPL